MRTRSVAMALSLCLFSVFSGRQIFGQESRGTITGRVLDPSGAAIAGAEVKASNTDTGVTSAGKANEQGIYTIPYLVPGTYTVAAEMTGFKTTSRPGIDVRVNAVLNLDLQLQVGNASEVLEVTGAPPLLEADNVSLGQVVDTRRINDLPLQAGNAAELALLAPGVVNTTNLRARKTSFNSASSQISTNGNALYSNEFTIDGVPDTFPNNGTPLVAFQPPQAAVTEFKVQTTAIDASLGHTPGSVLNISTQGGTNLYHGEAHEWMMNSALDTSTFFQNRAGQTKPVYQDNRFGAAIGGPVYIPKVYKGTNKTFFFYAWEHNTWGKPTTTVGTVPTDAEKNGDFSALLKIGSQYQIYNPFSTTPAAGGRYSRTPFAGNIIPSNLLDPVAKKILSYYAEPNTAGTVDGRNNYTRATKDTFDYGVHLWRLDHNFSDRNRAFVRLYYDKYLENNSNFYGNIANGLLLTRINRGGVLDDVITLSPTMILDVHYGITQEETPEQRRSHGIDLSTFGFSSQLLSLLNPATETFPNVYLNTKALSGSCTGACTGTYSGFGNFQSGDGTLTGQVHNVAATLTKLIGAHNIRIGTDLRLYLSNGFAGGYDVSPGFQFLPTYTNGPLDNTAAAPIGQELASMLLGIPSGQMTRSASYAFRNNYVAGFLQDDWKLTSKLTLNLGLRYEFESPVSERYGRAVRGFDYTTPNPIAAQAIAAYAKNPIPQLPVSQFKVNGGLLFASSNGQDLWNSGTGVFLPRIGLAYKLDDKTVIRSGYGIFYDTIGVNRTQAIQSGFTASTPIIASYDNGQHYVANLENPFPNGLLQPAGAAAGLNTFLGQALTFYPSKRLQPYSQRWTVDAQRQLPGRIVLELAYVGNKAVHLPVSKNINSTPQQYLSTLPTRDQATINTLSATVPNPFFGLNSVYPQNISVADLLRPYPQFGDITMYDNNGYSWYHALQVQAEKRFTQGLTLQLGFTRSKFMDATSYLNSGDASLNRGLSAYDRPSRITFSGIYEIPVGRGRMLGSHMNRVLDAVAGGWQLNTLFEQQSGSPLGLGDVILYGTTDQLVLPSDQRTIDRYFNTSIVETASTKQRQYDIRTFPKTLNGLRGPAQSQWNASLIKSFQLHERVRLQFRAECYDLLNRSNFSDPNTTATSSSFGTITAVGSPGRQFQGALKLTF